MVKKNYDKRQGEEIPDTIDMRYERTSTYRTYYTDGIYGGLTPRGMLHMELYIERHPTPNSETFELTEGRLGHIVERQGEGGVVREIEAGIMMDYGTMLAMKKWLDDKIGEYEERFMPPGRTSPIKH